MDWDMKFWDLSELEPTARASFASASGVEGQTSESDCSVDLKLGGSGDFRASCAPSRGAAKTASPSSSAKRARHPGAAIQAAYCLVEGCNSDLSGCREYHRRHKVCEVHSKTPIVIVNGVEQRFCQQCSRYHMLAEFDEGKRSCRKRLDGHNRRRRKPQPHAMHPGNLFADYPGSSISLYSEIFPAARSEPNWIAVVRTQEEVSCLRNRSSPSPFLGSHPRSYQEDRRFPFPGGRTLESAVCHPLLPAIAAASQGEMNEGAFHGGLAQVLDSELALSLLSSANGSVGINIGHVMPAGRIPHSQPSFSSFHQHGLPHYPHSQSSSQISSAGFSYLGLVDEQTGGLLVSEAGESDLHC